MKNLLMKMLILLILMVAEMLTLRDCITRETRAGVIYFKFGEHDVFKMSPKGLIKGEVPEMTFNAIEEIFWENFLIHKKIVSAHKETVRAADSMVDSVIGELVKNIPSFLISEECLKGELNA